MDETDNEKYRVPAWCPVCDEVMKGSISTQTYFKWGCCMHCHIEFVEDREERWKNGWRPSPDEVAKKRGRRIWGPDESTKS